MNFSIFTDSQKYLDKLDYGGTKADIYMGRNKYPIYPLRLLPDYKIKLEAIAKERGIPLSALILECLQSQFPDSTHQNY